MISFGEVVMAWRQSGVLRKLCSGAVCLVFPAIALLLVLGWVSESAAAVQYQAVGTVQNGTGAITVAWPAHQAGDIGLLVIETANQAVTLGTNAANWTQVTNSPQGTGTAATAGATRLTV